MASFVRVQLAGFTLAVVLVASLIGWTARRAWLNVAYLRDRYEEVDIQSYQFSEHILAAVLDLNQSLTLFEAEKQAGDRERFVTHSAALREWIVSRTPDSQTEAERSLMWQVGVAFTNYLAATTKLLEASAGRSESNPSEILVQARQAALPLFKLCHRLADAHTAALKAIVKDSQHRMARLQQLMLAGATLLLLFGGTIAALVYRTTIAPLRTQLVESRAIIERQEKLSSLGMLAAGVAHEIRNPLTAIKVRLHSLKRSVQADVSAREDATFIGEEIGRLERIVNDILQFARPADPQFATLEVGSFLREVHALLQPQVAARSVDFTLGPIADGTVQADPQQIKQVLINLIQNAAESITGTGAVTLRARAATLALAGRPAPVMILEVCDTGSGIPPEVQKRLFDPFFTTKDNGTGLGLAIAARIVQKHGGALLYQTQPGQGTTFGVVLPRLPHHETQNLVDRR
jgi:signal transduction histidine kinase